MTEQPPRNPDPEVGRSPAPAEPPPGGSSPAERPAAPPPSSELPADTPPPHDSPHAPSAGGEGNGLAVAALVTGIASILFLFIVGPLTAVIAIAAIVLGVMGRSRVKSGRTAQHQGLATAGLVMGIVMLVISVLLVALIIVGISALGGVEGIQQLQEQQP